MSAPIPRPPGLWRAVARDGVLNPEEAAARAAVVAAHQEPTAPDPAPREPPPDVVDASPQEQLIPYQALIDRARWKMSFTCTDDRARIEAFHPDGAAVMVTAVRGRSVNAYALPAARKKTPRWRVIHRSDLERFLRNRQVVDPHLPTSMCTCEKRSYPTEARAKDAIVDVTIKRVVKRHGLQSERRAYRCPDDDRTWHLTHIEKWYGDSTTQPAKEPA